MTSDISGDNNAIDGLGEPLIPLREPNPEALRAAVEVIAPHLLPALTAHLFQAATSAQQIQSLDPLRAFVHSWAVFVAINRRPERAARFRELEQIVDTSANGTLAAIEEINAIRESAESEAGL
ncbi:hypothetical protein SAMN05216223_13162 [Actinacidiphila yanglinensis]|uniref:Uncharacterized protein n=1 Tax=Actinacidiphila yanglinensis TaxID=310779 RepID=A0A1H6EAY0_9ACTN|nr:hypothetical protein [Actinacidiphila yanglinensis]SEG94907.1 hypothetical protein SAMN05216223_13162 [Actinacidiphila yanglinensis]